MRRSKRIETLDEESCIPVEWLNVPYVKLLSLSRSSICIFDKKIGLFYSP